MRNLFTVFLFSFIFSSAQSQTSADAAVALTATLQTNPTTVTLNWPMPAPVANVLLFRREKGSDTWLAWINDSISTASSYVDTMVTSGATYEYGIQRVVNDVAAFGYISVAVQAPVVEQRGKVLVFVEQALTASLTSELDRLKYDLAGDGWTVVWHPVAANATVVTIKNQIVADYNADPLNVKSVLLLGNLPVPYSGNSAWDGHPDHQGAWPADTYYGDMNGLWSDASVNNTVSSRPENDNIPGDGKFDQSIVPTASELAVGRVDFANLSPVLFGASTTELLRRYLDKDHKWRSKMYTVDNKTLIDDNFGYFGGEAFAANGWRNGYALTGPGNVMEADFFTATDTQSYLYGYGCGGGTYTSAGGVGTSTNFANDSINIVFSMLFGSYHGDWDYNPEPFMPAALASRGGILTCGWAGRPHWFLQHMAAGETVGYSAVETQNTCDNVGYPAYFGTCGAHVSLLGDPTLRAHIVAPASDLSGSSQCGSINLGWTFSPDPSVAGYQVLRSSQPYSGYTKISGGALVTANNYNDLNPPAGLWYYQVRAVKLETGTGGAFWNNSTGVFTSVNYIGGVTPDIAASGGLLTCYNDVDTLRGNSSTPGVSYEWSGPNGFSSSLQNAPVSETGTYVLTVTAPNSCTSSIAVTVIEDITVPLVSAQAGEITCLGPAQLTGSTNAGQAQWTGPNGFISNLLNTTTGTAGVYTLTALNVFNGCTATATATVNENFAVPENITAAANGIINCAFNSVTLLAVSSTNGAFFAWTGPNGFSAQGASAVTSQPGTYTVVVTHPVTGCTASGNTTVLSDFTEPGATATGAELTCTEPNATLMGSSSTGGVTYTWTGPGGFASTEQNPVVTSAGNYNLTVTAPNGCTSTATAVVTVDVSVPNVDADGGLITCFTYNDTVRGHSTTPGVSFFWTGPGGFTANTQNAEVTVTGTYTLVVTAPSGCTNSVSVEVTADLTLPTIGASAPDEINCVNASVAIHALDPGGFIFWEGPDGFVSTESDPVVSVPGIYIVTVINPLNGCSASASAEVIADTAPPLIEAVGGVLFCANSTVTLAAIVSPGVVVAWPGLPGGENPVVSAPGSYIAVALDLNNGCSNSDTAVVTQVSPFLSVSIDPVILNCDGTSIQSVSVSGGTAPYIYLWSNGATNNPTIYPNGPGNFIFTATDSEGCTQVISGDLPVIEVLAVTATATNESAVGAADGTATAAVSGDGAPYSYLWSNAASTPSITGLTAGTYTVTVTGSNGCTAVSSVVVEVEVGTSTPPAGWSIQLAPNPAGAYTWLDMHFPHAQDALVTVEDLAGRILLTVDNGIQQNSRLRLETGMLPGGLYLVRIHSDGKTFTMKLVKSE